MAPFDAIDKTAFARAASSGASAMKMKSYWPITIKKSFKIKPHDWNSVLAAWDVNLVVPTLPCRFYTSDHFGAIKWFRQHVPCTQAQSFSPKAVIGNAEIGR